MQSFISKAIHKLGAKLIKISHIMYVSPQEKRCIPWFQNNGDKTLRLNYPLTDKSIVLDLGGYEGQWASDIFSRYCCFIHVFEPSFRSPHLRLVNSQSIYTQHFTTFYSRQCLFITPLIQRHSYSPKLIHKSIVENQGHCQQVDGEFCPKDVTVSGGPPPKVPHTKVAARPRPQLPPCSAKILWRRN